ncbi:hypothetical protein BD413DRAFT_611064 [Trametes elegans]|nr:hypothetical protein BD413DRAFT_611064 [Trametes elegans]
MSHPDPVFSAAQVYHTLEGYVASLAEANRGLLALRDEEATRACGTRVLSRIAAELPALCARLTRACHHRCTLRHDDLVGPNILIDAQGDVTGMIDWECHAMQPAALAVEYPHCIRYDGVCDPAYRKVTGKFECWWFASREYFEQLREVYAEAVKARDCECWEALVGGELPRRIVEWLSGFPAFESMEKWMDTASPRV